MKMEESLSFFSVFVWDRQILRGWIILRAESTGGKKWHGVLPVSTPWLLAGSGLSQQPRGRCDVHGLNRLDGFSGAPSKFQVLKSHFWCPRSMKSKSCCLNGNFPGNIFFGKTFQAR